MAVSGLEGFPITAELPVQWGEMDAFGHVNNVVYFRYFEHARIAYFRAMDLPGFTSLRGVGPIVHSTKARFRIPLTYPDAVRIGARVEAVEADRFTMSFRLISERHQAVAAEGDAVVVVYDHAHHKKATVDDAIRAAIARVEGRAARGEGP